MKAKISSDEAAIGYISFASVSDGVKAPVSYTHLDVYKRQVKETGSSPSENN